MLNVKPLSQRDREWKDILLGFNTNPTYSIGGYGCLITCLAVAANWYGRHTDPKKLNKKLKDVSGFANGGYYVWNSITKIYPEIIEERRITPIPLTQHQVSEIKEWLDKGYPVMLMVDMYPETAPVDMHFVLLVGYSDNDWTIADPWDGKIKPISDYLGKFAKTFEQCVEQYIGLISDPPESFLSPVSEPSEVELLKNNISLLEKSLEDSRANEDILMEKINDLDKKYENLEKEHAEEVKLLTEQRTKYQKNDAEFRKTVQDVFDENNEAIEDLEKRVLRLQKPEEVSDMNRITKLWENLPKTLKVFCFIALSTILSELAIELGGLEQTFLIRTLAQIINLGLVGVEEGVPAIKARLKK